MITLKKIKDDLETISTVGVIVDVYQRTAHAKMMKIRQDVLKSREFLDELGSVYHAVRRSHEFFLKKTMERKNEESFSVEERRGEVLVFLSANHFFYGSLLLDIWTETYNFWKKNKPDLVVVGRTGKYLAESYKLGHKIFYFDLDDANPKKNKIGEIINFVKKYKKIVVSHGRFESVLVQNPAMSDIFGDVQLKEEKKNTGKGYLFEPTPKAVMDFFETEIMASLFNQTFLEHSLARHAKRMISMYHASENAKKRKQEIEKNKKRIEWREMDKKQVETFSAYQLWEKLMT